MLETVVNTSGCIFKKVNREEHLIFDKLWRIFFFLAKRKRIAEFLEFRNRNTTTKKKKAVKTSTAEDIGFTELKITKVSIQSELFAFRLHVETGVS